MWWDVSVTARNWPAVATAALGAAVAMCHHLSMRDGYRPTSEFLNAVLVEEASLRGKGNLEKLITTMRDADPSNRDWATFLLAQEDIDTPAVRAALLSATSDASEVVRAEAIAGLARRDPHLALPLVQQALRCESVTTPILEAAALCAHPSLVADLRAWAEPSDNPHVDQAAATALAACEHANPEA